MISVTSPPTETRRLVSSLSAASTSGAAANDEMIAATENAIARSRLLCGSLRIVISRSSRDAGSCARQVFHDGAPIVALVSAFLTLAEELDDHFAFGIVGLE